MVRSDSTWVIILLTMWLGINGAITLTSLHNPKDLSPNYVPTIYGIVISIASTTEFINSMIVGWYGVHESNIKHIHKLHQRLEFIQTRLWYVLSEIKSALLRKLHCKWTVIIWATWTKTFKKNDGTSNKRIVVLVEN